MKQSLRRALRRWSNRARLPLWTGAALLGSAAVVVFADYPGKIPAHTVLGNDQSSPAQARPLTASAPVLITGGAVSVAVATSSTFGTVKPDGTTCSVSSGVLTCAGSGLNQLTGGVVAGPGTGAQAATVITNANLTGPITSSGNDTAVASQTGTGSTFVMNTGPTLTAPALGAATATSLNKLSITTPATSATLTVADGKTLTDTSAVGAVALKGATGGGFAQAACGDLSNAGAGCTASAMSNVAGGLVPTPPNDATKYLDGTGAFSTPAGAGSGPTTVTFTNSVIWTSNGSNSYMASSPITVATGDVYRITASVCGWLTSTHGIGVGIFDSNAATTHGFSAYIDFNSNATLFSLSWNGSTLGNTNLRNAASWTNQAVDCPYISWVIAFGTSAVQQTYEIPGSSLLSIWGIGETGQLYSGSTFFIEVLAPTFADIKKVTYQKLAP